MDQKEAIAYLLIEHTKDEATAKVEKCLASGDTYAWRDIVRFEFDTEILLETLLRYDVVLPKLILYEIKTISPFHYAALRGNKDILVSYLDKDLPIDLSLKSGSTALHLACFAGHRDIVNLLIEVYKADLDKQDNYGWTALHYASTQGQLEVVKLLVEKKADVTIRDKDGTTAAFRAQVNEHDHVVTFICATGDEEELLNIYEKLPADSDYQFPNAPPLKQHSMEDIYAVPNKGKFKNMNRSASEDGGANTGATGGRGKKQSKRAQLDSIRRVIRTALTEGEYESPVGARDSEDASHSARMSGIGMNTLRGVFREELDKYRRELFTTPQSSLNVFVPVKKKENYVEENPYASIGNLGQAPRPPIPPMGPIMEDSASEVGPPLPPRNSSQLSLGDLCLTPDPEVEQEELDTTYIRLQAVHPTSEALNQCVVKLAPVLGTNWKKLAYELPIEGSRQKVEGRIKAIEKKYPGQLDKQAATALAEWRINRNVAADTDSLILALRRCNLHDVIDIVDRATQEFTA